MTDYLQTHVIEAIIALGGVLALCRLAWEIRK